jgi:hypothetical protein
MTIRDKAQEIKNRARGRRDFLKGLTGRAAIPENGLALQEMSNLAGDVSTLAALVGSLADRLSPPEPGPWWNQEPPEEDQLGTLETTVDQMAAVQNGPSGSGTDDQKATQAAATARRLIGGTGLIGDAEATLLARLDEAHQLTRTREILAEEVLGLDKGSDAYWRDLPYLARRAASVVVAARKEAAAARDDLAGLKQVIRDGLGD